MRRIILMVGILAVMFGALAIGVLAPRVRAEVTALGNCIGQARTMPFGPSLAQARNFVKDCMIDKRFPGHVN